MFAKLRILGLSLGLAALLSPLASADGFGISIAKKGKHSSLTFGFTTGVACKPPPPCAPSVWVPAQCVTVLKDVWIESQQQKVWCEPVFEWHHDACGHAHKVLVVPGHWSVVCVPGHFETRRVQEWQPAHWTTPAH